jgi:DNA modification methylase
MTCYFGDCRETMRRLIAEGVRVQTCVTSPPYWGLRDYGHAGQIGLEATPDEYVHGMVEVFGLVRELLNDDGTLWLNLGDSYCSTAPGTMGDKLNQRGILAGVSDRRAEGSRKPRPNTPDGLKPKDLVGIPWRVAFALQADGWYLRSDIIWHKPNPMPESVTDRPTKSHEYIFLLSKSERYYYDHKAIQEPAAEASLSRWAQDVESQAGSNRVPGKTNGPMRAVGGPVVHGNKPGRSDGGAACNKPGQESRNKRTVWTVTTQPYSGAHFATYPSELIEPCILAGSRAGDLVLDPFLGSGTTGEVSERLGRKWIGCELNEAYAPLQKERTAQRGLILA